MFEWEMSSKKRDIMKLESLKKDRLLLIIKVHELEMDLAGLENRQLMRHIFSELKGWWKEHLRQVDNIISCLGQLQILKDPFGTDKSRYTQIKDAFTAETYSGEDVIVRDGEVGDRLCIVLEGTLYAEQSGRRLKEYKDGDFFGEHALTGLGRKSSFGIVVSSDMARILSLRAETFLSICDPLT